MSNTNDEQAPYGVEPTEDELDEIRHGNKPTARAPMLSDEDIRESMLSNAKWVRDFYEAKITSGELRAYKNLGTRLTKEGTLCNECGRWINVAYDRFCPGCGAQIAK